MRTHPTRWKRRPRHTLAQEFRESFRAGPRVWCLAAFVLGGAVSRWTGALLLLGGVLLLSLRPWLETALARLAAVARDVRMLWRLQRTPPELRRPRRAPGTAP
jgi:hypothetical protein